MGHKSPSAIAYWQRALAANHAANTPTSVSTAETLSHRRACQQSRREGTYSHWPTFMPRGNDGSESAGHYNWRVGNKNLGGVTLRSGNATAQRLEHAMPDSLHIPSDIYRTLDGTIVTVPAVHMTAGHLAVPYSDRKLGRNCLVCGEPC